MNKLIKFICVYILLFLVVGCIQKEILNEKPVSKTVKFNINLDIGGTKAEDNLIENMGECLSFAEIEQLNNTGNLFVKFQLQPLSASNSGISYEFDLPIKNQLINGKLQTATISISAGEYNIKKAALYSKESKSTNQLLYTAITSDSKYAIYVPEGKRLDEFTFIIPEETLQIVSFDLWMICYKMLE